MLEARLEEAGIFKKLLDAMKDIVNDGNFDCSENGISLQSMDNAQIALISLLLRASAFTHYRCDRNLNLGISIANLAKIVRSANTDDGLTLRAEDEADVLNIVFEGKARTSEYDLKLMDIDAEHLQIPDCEFDAIVTMPSSEFNRIVKDMMVISDTEAVQFKTEGDIGNAAVTVKSGCASIDEKDEEMVTSINCSRSCNLTYALKFLNNFTKATALSPFVTLHLSNEYPLMVEYKVNETGYIRFYLAPKIEEEDDQ